jgi:transmembrane sensor
MEKNSINVERINRFLSGEYSEEDKLYLNEVFCDRDNAKELEKFLRKQWYGLLSENELKENQLDHVLYRIHYEINNKIQKPNQTKSKFVKWFSRVAAILILPSLIYSGFHLYRSLIKENTSWVEIKAPAWTRAQFTLPDGTVGWLNSNSSLKYNGNFILDRQVMLIGEAYFDVFKDKSRPFIVNTNEVSVKVLGTRFNIASYENERDIEVVLDEGFMVFNVKEKNKAYTMAPNDLVTYDKTVQDFSIETVQPQKYLSWTEGRLEFRNDPLDIVARRLARWYNIDVELNVNLNDGPRLRATFIDESIEEVMDLIKRSLPVDYKIENRNLLPDGTYSKTKVIIYSRTK